MGWRYEDIRWPGEHTACRVTSPFSASWSSTVELLERELRQLDAERVVLQVAISESDLRVDGKPLTRAVASHPGVILAFESKYGPVKFAVDRFRTWQENLRAIALAMEALRRVDRYGVTRRGEQYTGWRALPASTDPADTIQTVEQAQELLDRYGGEREALRQTHPDRGGNPDEFRRVMRARELLEAAR